MGGVYYFVPFDPKARSTRARDEMLKCSLAFLKRGGDD